MKLAVIIPTYQAFKYAKKTLESFFKYNNTGDIIVVDDTSPDWGTAWLDDFPKDRLVVHRFKNNGGLTRSWNWGLNYANSKGYDYVVIGNNDIIFTPGWFKPIKHGLDNGWHLLGPITNAPGSSGDQKITYHFKNFYLTDEYDYLESLSNHNIFIAKKAD